MATQRPGFAVSYPELAAALLTSSEVVPRARLIAQQVAGVFPECAVVVYTFDENEGWQPKATEGDVAFAEATVAPDAGTLGALRAKQDTVIFGSELPREEYAHLNIRRTVVALAGIPLFVDENLVGAIEVLSFRNAITEASVASLSDFVKIAALGMAAGAAYEAERNAQLESITRVTQMYDLEKVFNSNLEMDDLMKMITTKFQEVMSVQAVNLWMVDGDGVTLTAQAGYDATAGIGASEKPGEGIPGDISDSGQPLLIDDSEDPRLAKRNEGIEEGAIFSVVAAPVMDRGSLVGVVEAINRTDGVPFDDDDEFLLTTICETASNALHNASLLQAERKLEIMETLVTVSQEITSTLNLDRVLQTIVNAPQAVIPFERASIGLLQSGKFKLSAITGKTQVNTASPEVRQLDDVLQWAALSGEVVDVRERDGEIDDPRPETVAKFKKYFADSGMRGFYAKPLNDDTGHVGILCLESSDPDFLTDAHFEIIQVLAGQATVALRNAMMYKDVPFISVLEPVMERKRRFMAQEKRKRRATYTAAIAIALFLVIIPVPMRVDGDAVVAPAHRVQIQPEVEGVVQKVYVHEGDRVTRGTVLAEVADWEYRAALSAANAKYESAQLMMNRALASNDGTEAGIQRVQADYWRSEVTRAKELLDKTRLRSPIEGIVATPHIENMVGRRLQFGDSFAEVVDASHAVVDIAVDDDLAGLLKAGSSAAVKLNFYPTHTFRGEVGLVSPKGEVQGESRVFYARVNLPNDDGGIRSGMQGRGKVTVGWRPSGYVLFRGPALWLYSKIWYWFGW